MFFLIDIATLVGKSGLIDSSPAKPQNRPMSGKSTLYATALLRRRFPPIASGRTSKRLIGNIGRNELRRSELL
jgi:hypothetical protein